MIKVRHAGERGSTRTSWLDSRHTFSFNDYYDPDYSGFRSLRVLNEDVVAPGAGFGTHGHRDMEILSYVLEGALEHKDSAGGGGVIRPGEIQFMRAGTGVTHSERNASSSAPVHFLQIWIVPDTRGPAPTYGQKPFDRAKARAGFLPLVSPDGRDGTLQVKQNASLLVSVTGAREKRICRLAEGRRAWLQVARGSLSLNGQALEAGDGAAVEGETAVELVGRTEAEVLLFDLA
jgi:redox-sensitive bicupin YhaK (pirin superfamily)